jgi:hypothetical protein
MCSKIAAPSLEQRLLAAACTREQELLALVETDAREALHRAVPSQIRASFPASAQTDVHDDRRHVADPPRGRRTGSVQTLAATLPNMFGAQRALMILVTFTDKPTPPYTVDYAKSVAFTTTSNSDLENS